MNYLETVFLLCSLVGTRAGVSIRQLETQWTVPYLGCNISFVWFSVSRLDNQVLSLPSHIHTCQQQVLPKGFNVVNFSAVEMYFKLFNADSSKTARYFYLADTILNRNILMTWQPGLDESESSLQLKLINPFRQDYVYKPQHILCYRKACPPINIATPPSYKIETVRTNLENVKEPSTVVFDPAASSNDYGWSANLFLYKVLCKVIGALVFFMLGVICVLGLLYRKAIQQRREAQKQLEHALNFPKSKTLPVFGDISRRKYRAGFQNQEHYMGTKVALLNQDNFSLTPTTPRSSFTMGHV